MASQPLEPPGQPKRERVTQIVQRVGENGDAVGECAADQLSNGKQQIQEKRYPDPGRVGVVLMVIVTLVAAHATGAYRDCATLS